EEANTLFSRLSDGGRVTVPLSKMFWGAYFGMLTDKFGIQWMVSFDEKQHA
ncbi:MAG TPA: VOC family protein, partial [Flavisolibacter sp.]